MGFLEWCVLIVEDQTVPSSSLLKILNQFEIWCISASTVEEALYLLKNNPFTHIIVDLSLRDTNPWQLLNKLQEYTDQMDLPRIAVTDYHQIGLAETAIKAGFSGYFIKPVDDVVLLCALQNTIGD